MAEDSKIKMPSPSKSVMVNQQTPSLGDKTFQGVGNLIRLLPTGTLFLFQFLSSVVTNNGHCYTINKYLTGSLPFLCGFMCSFSCFTDSYAGRDGRIQYGVVTKEGLWALSDPDAKSMDLSRYKLRLGDFAHAFLTLIVFVVVALLYPNIVGCYYSSFETTQTTLLMVLPPVVGSISSTVFWIFPYMRHGIGYPPTNLAAAAPMSLSMEDKTPPPFSC